MSAPKAGSLLPSKLQVPAVTNGSNSVASNIPAKPTNQVPQKTGISGNYEHRSMNFCQTNSCVLFENYIVKIKLFLPYSTQTF